MVDALDQKINELILAARKELQEFQEKLTAEYEGATFVSESPDGMVKITMSPKLGITAVDISTELHDRAVMSTLLSNAINDVAKKVIVRRTELSEQIYAKETQLLMSVTTQAIMVENMDAMDSDEGDLN